MKLFINHDPLAQEHFTKMSRSSSKANRRSPETLAKLIYEVKNVPGSLSRECRVSAKHLAFPQIRAENGRETGK
jgi:hypothetical protein